MSAQLPNPLSWPPWPARHPRAGRWLIRTGIAGLCAVFALSVLESILAWGETSSTELLACAAAAWLAGGMLNFGLAFRGYFPPVPFRVGRTLLTLPASLAIAYYGPAIEHFAAWWALLLPNATFDLLHHTVGLSHMLALAPTVILAPLEIALSLLVPQTLIISPLKAIFGSDSAIVDNARDLVGSVEFRYDAYDEKSSPALTDT